MTRARLRIKLDAGVEVEMLFTPHLYAYKGQGGVTLALPDESLPENDRLKATMSLYADVFWFAALNAWELDGNEGDPPFRRSDFHEWSTLHPRAFAKAMGQAIEALTGRPITAPVQGADGEGGATAQEDAEGAGNGKKKVSEKSGRRLRRFFSGR